MTIITKGMGAVLKSIKTLKKSKKFPGPDAEKKLMDRFKQRQKKGERVTGETVATDPTMQRIHRTQSRRDTKALQIKEFRKDKGRFTSYTGNPPGANLPEGKMIKIYKPGSEKKDLRKFKEFIKTGTRKK